MIWTLYRLLQIINRTNNGQECDWRLGEDLNAQFASQHFRALHLRLNWNSLPVLRIISIDVHCSIKTCLQETWWSPQDDFFFFRPSLRHWYTFYYTSLKKFGRSNGCTRWRCACTGADIAYNTKRSEDTLFRRFELTTCLCQTICPFKGFPVE